MRTYFPHDLTSDYRRIQSAHRRRRTLAAIGATLFCLLVGLSLGSLICGGGFGLLAAVLSLSAWGVWGLNQLLTRH